MGIQEPYSRDEIDLKMENLFQRFELDSNRRNERLSEEFKQIDTTFRLLEKHIDWLTKITMANFGVLLSLVIGLIAALLGIFFPIAWTLWSNIGHLPVK